MKQPINHEEAIEKVLSGLRETEAPEGLEQRILRRVAELEAQPAPWRPAWLAIPGRGRSLAYGLAAATLIVAGLTLVAVHRPLLTPLQRGMAKPAAPLPVAEIAPVVTVATIRLPAPHPPRRLTRTPKSMSTASEEDPETAQARRDMLAASHPAPPMPLTEQERLLMRIAHTGDPQELVALNAELRDRARAVREAEFREFFPQPPEPPSEQ